MPIFIGAVLKKDSFRSITEMKKKFTEIISQNTKKQTITIATSFWLTCAAQKDYEMGQEDIIPLPNKNGILIGRVYNNDGCSVEKNSFDRSRFSVDKDMNEYWGRYVLISANSTNKIISIYRDQIGLSHLYFIDLPEGIFFSSDIYLLLSITAEKHKFSRDWEYFSSYLSYGLLHTSRTPFKEINELLPGCFLTYNRSEYRIHQFWKPTSFVLKKKYLDRIAPLLDQCVKNIVNKSTSLALQLSGGLDSTALYMSINKNRENNQNFILINYINRLVGTANELEYVNKLLENTDYDLLVHEWNLTVYPKKTEKWNRPDPGILGINNKISLLEKLNFKNIELINGHGGDHLFLASANDLFLTDYLLQEGTNGFIDKLINVCLIKRSPILSCLFKSVVSLYQYIFLRNSHKHNIFVKKKNNWFKPELEELIKSEIFFPPFFDELSSIYPGKALHILEVYHASAQASFEAPGITELYPYLSLPLVELALSIPTYDSLNSNWTRFHFRKAIADYFQTNLVWRQSKGDASGVTQLCIRENKKRIQELCLEGQFAKHNLIYKDLLNKQINLVANGLVTEQWSIINLLSIELWFEEWATP